ncbi:phospholipase D-like domain-containing protein [Alkalimonas sp. MEB004]|uniref:Phospholipase D-like domain-containing protein n=2 Tax=Alkalimonas mucilaginosa TaxID=3057676 RepID=A0ABU7JBH7_9GAMM|nr:phospholipase D-like domain-containing protein [Alkalimonas sp. MEB004]MEE2023053.1 phospholipase D-like domain-containing protein [Alkalimonas sp. MEB004]
MLFNAMPKPIRLQSLPTPDYGIADPRFQRSMGALLNYPLVEGNEVTVLRNGEAIYSAMIEAVDQAKHSVSFETYEFWGEDSAGALSDALVRAAERGVRVHALIDFIGSRSAAPEKFERMQAAGVEVELWRKPSWYQLARFNHRTHRKLLLVDGGVGFTGGANIANNWLPEGDKTYRDNHFLIRGPVVASMQSTFAESWLDARGDWLHGEAYFPELEQQGALTLQMVNSSPREGRHRMRPMLLYAISAAQSQITAATAYFYPDQAFLDALRDAAQRGVQVRILVPGDSIDQGYLRQASVNRWGEMLAAGVELYEYQPAMYHSKLISIDDQWASIGSTNLDNRSLRINGEANVNLYGEKGAAMIRELIDEDMADAERYTLEQWRQRGWSTRFWGAVGSIIGPHL